MIHPTAIISPQAKLGPGVRVGPYAVIDADVELGADCIVGPHVYLAGRTRIGARNRFFAGAVIGEAPQDLKYKDQPTEVRIGDDNVFREHVTVNRATNPGEETVVGSNGFFMAGAHIAHNCTVGDGVIMANGVMLGGHASVGDRAFLSGSCLVHQFTRVGALSIMQGGAAVTVDLPPYCVVRRFNELCGLNIVGLRRAGLTPAERLELKQLYHALFRSGQNLRAAVAAAREKFHGAHARHMLEFVATTKRGLCSDCSRRAGAAPEEG
jgi:UDP-N-acetylglucosamine acyltransferase